MRCEHFCTIFFDFSCVRPNLFLITGIRVIICGMAFYHPNRLSCLRVFPYDRFKIYTIIPIELNSIQLIKVVSVVRVICWNNQDDHMETRHACLTMCITMFQVLVESIHGSKVHHYFSIIIQPQSESHQT